MPSQPQPHASQIAFATLAAGHPWPPPPPNYRFPIFRAHSPKYQYPATNERDATPEISPTDTSDTSLQYRPAIFPAT